MPCPFFQAELKKNMSFIGAVESSKRSEKNEFADSTVSMNLNFFLN